MTPFQKIVMYGVILCAVAWLVSGCTSGPVFQDTKFVVITAPDELFVCPNLSDGDFPTGTFSQSDVAALLAKEQARADTCAASLQAVHDYQQTEKQSVGKNGISTAPKSTTTPPSGGSTK